MSLIVPAIIAKDFSSLQKSVTLAERFHGCGMVQLDIMDGKFVPGVTVGAQDIAKLQTRLTYELHLMIEVSEKTLQEYIALAPERIVIHYRATKSRKDLFCLLKECKIQTAIALDIGVSVAVVPPLSQYIDSVLLMSVVPGEYGAKFHPSVYSKILKIREMAPDLPIAVDGGVSLKNCKKLAALGAERLCVGSRIFQSDDPIASFQELTRMVSRV